MIQEFGEYVQYLIASILLFIFYKKFIANNEIALLDSSTGKDGSSKEDLAGYNAVSDQFDAMGAQTSLKAKVKSQIMNNLDGLDPEEIAKYEVLIEEIDQVVSNNPEDIAKMIEMLLSEGDTVLKSSRKDS